MYKTNIVLLFNPISRNLLTDKENDGIITARENRRTIINSNGLTDES